MTKIDCIFYLRMCTYILLHHLVPTTFSCPQSNCTLCLIWPSKIRQQCGLAFKLALPAKRWETQWEKEKARGTGERRSTAGFVSSFFSVWLPDICWPFQPSQRRPPSPSPPPYPTSLPLPSRARVLSSARSLRFQPVEIRVERKTAWSGEKRRERGKKGGWEKGGDGEQERRR